jgi:hypothetical protein
MYRAEPARFPRVPWTLHLTHRGPLSFHPQSTTHARLQASSVSDDCARKASMGSRRTRVSGGLWFQRSRVRPVAIMLGASPWRGGNPPWRGAATQGGLGLAQSGADVQGEWHLQRRRVGVSLGLRGSYGCRVAARSGLPLVPRLCLTTGCVSSRRCPPPRLEPHPFPQPALIPSDGELPMMPLATHSQCLIRCLT